MRLRAGVLAVAVAAALAGCGGAGGSTATGRRSPGSRPRARHSAAGTAGAARSGYATVTVSVPAGNRAKPFNSRRRLRVPRGWRVEVWARVASARLEQWTPTGDLLVSEPVKGRIVELIPHRDRARPPSKRVIVSGLKSPQGMAFDRVGGHEVLYVAETDEIDRYIWLKNHVGARRVLIPGLPSGSDHILKNVVVGPNHDLFFDIGSTANASPSPHSNPPYASVMQYTSAGRRIRVWATGVRNGDGLSFAPDGSLWTAVNERDQVAYPFHRAFGGHSDAYGQVIQSYVNNHPPDEVAKLTPGRNLGWPYCNPDPDVHRGAAGTSFTYRNLHFDIDAQNNPGGSILACGKLQPLQVGIPAHSAPLGFHFLQGSRLPAKWRDGAILAVHGSWDRQPPRAPAVLWLPWQKSSRTLGPSRQLISGFQNRDGSRWGRVVDAVAGPDGALYVSDQSAAAIYRIVP